MVVLKQVLVDLVHIVQAYNIFGDKAKAIQVCVNRFDDETKQAFLELYDKVDADFQMPGEEINDDEQFIHPYGPLVYKTKISNEFHGSD